MPIAQLDRASVSGTDDSGSTPDRHTHCINQPLAYLLCLLYQVVVFVFQNQ